MLRAVLNSTVLVGAFLRRAHGGAAYSVLAAARKAEYDFYLSPDIIAETRRVLVTSERNRQRYRYVKSTAIDYCRELVRFATLVTDVPKISVVRDPTDDAILGAAIAAHADFLVSRRLRPARPPAHHGDIRIVDPETFLAVLAKR